ncbi:MAG TPA: glycosyltransferase family 87 protein [Chthonomonadaceae bacterium]|nr:glycosyltransferase family 87 protein [Chthonomonadaceae bacterium]
MEGQAAPNDRWRRRAALIPAVVLLAGLAALHVAALFYAFTSRKYFFFDFRCYYIAVAFLDIHTNPYDRVTGIQPFVYTPCALILLKCFTVYKEFDAERQWMVVKCLAGMLILLLLRRQFNIRLGVKQWLLIAGGFTFAVVQDLATGNVSLFEQLLVWAGFAALLTRRYLLFAACLVIAAQFKLTTALLLPCVLLIDGDSAERRRQWIALAAGVAMLVAAARLNSAIWPRWTHDMAANLALIDYDGAACDPASRAFFDDAARALGVGAAAPALYATFIVMVLAVSARAFWRYRGRTRKTDGVLVIMFACVVYALLLPRLKLYSYVLVLPPAMLLADRARGWKAVLILALCLLPTHNLVYPFDQVTRAIAGAYDAAHVPAIVSNYTSLFALFAMWLWYLGELRRAKPTEADPAVQDVPAVAPAGSALATSAAPPPQKRKGAPPTIDPVPKPPAGSAFITPIR